MRNQIAIALCVVLAGLTGCQGSLQVAPETPPPKQGPQLAEDCAVRPEYIIGGGPKRMGTGFVVKDKAGKGYMLTAAHVMDHEADWNKVAEANMIRLGQGGHMIGGLTGKPIHVGKPFDKSNASQDLVIWPIAQDAKVTPLKLAKEDPKKNEWVWVVGQEARRDDQDQSLFLCKVTGADSGGILLKQHDEFVQMAFSGAPIVNAQGEVIGSMLGGRDSTILASKVSSIRERLTQAKVELP
jgi:S1-C subfamily serine protease